MTIALQIYSELFTLSIALIVLATVLGYCCAYVALQRRGVRHPSVNAFALAVVASAIVCTIFVGVNGRPPAARVPLTLVVYLITMSVPLALSVIAFHGLTRVTFAPALGIAALVGVLASPLTAYVGLDLSCRFKLGCV